MSKVRVSELDLKDKLVYVGRTAKVVKGGRRFNFTALVVVGDGNGYVGYGLGKAGEVVDAVSKATNAAKNNIVKVQLQKTTIPHEVLAKYGAASVLIKPATAGTGVIAGGGVRAVLELAGVQDVLTKSIGSSNPHNTVKATIRALTMLEDAQSVQDSGAFAIVIEGIPRELAKEITNTLSIPTIGIGAGPDCDGQVLVLHDILGLTQNTLKFTRKYADIRTTSVDACKQFVAEVRNGSWPDDDHSFH